MLDEGGASLHVAFAESLLFDEGLKVDAAGSSFVANEVFNDVLVGGRWANQACNMRENRNSRVFIDFVNFSTSIDFVAFTETVIKF